VAETNSLLNCRTEQSVPGVRIPPSPLFLSRQTPVGSHQSDERLLKRSASQTQTVSRTHFARWTICLLQNEKTGSWIRFIFKTLVGTPFMDHEVIPITVISWQKAETGVRSFNENVQHLKLKLFLEHFSKSAVASWQSPVGINETF
jgi:hypothetical protein